MGFERISSLDSITVSWWQGIKVRFAAKTN